MPGSSGVHAALGDVLRALVHGQVTADAMSGAMVEVEAGLPQRPAGEGVKVDAARARGKARRGNGDVALEHEREALLHLPRRACRSPPCG